MVYYWEAAVFAEGSFGYFDAGGGLSALVFAAINQGYYAGDYVRIEAELLDHFCWGAIAFYVGFQYGI